MRPRLAAALAGASLAPAALLLAVPAQAATPTVTITWDGSKFTSNPTVSSGTIVKWKNAGTTPTAGALQIAYKSGPTKFAPISIAPGATSSGTRMTGLSTTTQEVVRGSQPVLVQTNVGSGTITIRAVAAPPPPSSHPPTTKPPAPAAHTTQPATQPAPKPAPAPPTGVTNPPPLGIGGVAPPPPSPAGPGPLLAGPQPQPTPTTDTAAPANEVPAQALSQPVPARKYGLPGALAAVLLAGVAVGVVRLARVDYANGNGHATGAPPTEPPNPE